MKRKLLLLCGVIFLVSNIYSQKTFFDYDMLNMLYKYSSLSQNGHKEVNDSMLNAVEDTYREGTFEVWNILTGSSSLKFECSIFRNLIEVLSIHDDNYDYGIYGFGILRIPSFDDILIKHKDDYVIINMNMDFKDVVGEVLRYFEKYPEVDHRLLPLYMKAVVHVYNINNDCLDYFLDDTKRLYECILFGPNKLKYVY